MTDFAVVTAVVRRDLANEAAALVDRELLTWGGTGEVGLLLRRLASSIRALGGPSDLKAGVREVLEGAPHPANEDLYARLEAALEDES